VFEHIVNTTQSKRPRRQLNSGIEGAGDNTVELGRWPFCSNGLDGFDPPNFDFSGLFEQLPKCAHPGTLLPARATIALAQKAASPGELPQSIG